MGRSTARFFNCNYRIFHGDEKLCPAFFVVFSETVFILCFCHSFHQGFLIGASFSSTYFSLTIIPLCLNKGFLSLALGWLPAYCFLPLLSGSMGPFCFVNHEADGCQANIPHRLYDLHNNFWNNRCFICAVCQTHFYHFDTRRAS